ncbi:MAG TPA: alpha/beta hydrolase, partial [Anaerolineales bacterium]|nr:alpha/beta hydrolase [Anaerolineales bacterium]
CLSRLLDGGINLSLFNSAQSAADIQLLRQALEYAEVDLLGISYGTRLALTVMRDHPEGIRSVILDSVYPPEVDAYTEQPLVTMQGLELLAADCQADPDCRQAYPNLFQMLTEVVGELNDSPVMVNFYDTEYDEDYQEAVRGDDVVTTISDAMYDSKVIPYLPAFIGAMYDGQYDHAYEILDLPYANDSGSYYEEDIDLSDAEGMFYAVECYEEAVFTDVSQAEDLVSSYPFTFTEGLIWGTEDFLGVCSDWAGVQAGSIEDQPVSSSIPILVLNGEYDPVTPPSWAQGAAAHLANSQVFIFPGYGHAVIDAGPCPVALMVDFLANPSQPVDASCLAQVSPPDFVINP